MELYDPWQYGSLEEWLTQRRILQPWQTTDPMDELLATSHGVNPLHYSDTNLGPTSLILPNPCFDRFSATLDQELSSIDATYNVPFAASQLPISGSAYSVPLSAPTTVERFSSYDPLESYALTSLMEEEADVLLGEDFGTLEMTTSSCKTEAVVSPNRFPVPRGKKNRTPRVEGQPSKNLMAERRRRKRVNDRLSMLRSIVPKISKMDRTSILGDTIDYMKELLDKIQKLQGTKCNTANEMSEANPILQHSKPNEMLVRSAPKFNVERLNDEMTRVSIVCSVQPGLLLSTVATLESLGLEIQQCVISCFNEFGLQASCSKEMGLHPEDIKQALFRNAGYGGRKLDVQ